MIYVDNNATTPIAPEVAQAMAEAYAAGYLNPASQHRPGQRARRRLDDARDTILNLLGGETTRFASDRLIFTSGGTEANNLALFGLGGDRPGQVIISAIEHPSIAEAAQQLQARGTAVRILPVDGQGVVQYEQLDAWLEQPTRMVSVMLANNETGAIQPIQQISTICRKRNVPLHVDAVQAVGKIPVSFEELAADAMTVSPHKFHGPRGIGGLILGHGVKLNPTMFGGSQQLTTRPGTESVELAIGFETALRLAIETLPEAGAKMQSLRNLLETTLLEKLGAERVCINGGKADRLPHTTNLAFPGLNRQALVMALDMVGVACSSGSACASGSSEPSPTLLAMGLSEAMVAGSIRVSFSRFSSEEEVREASGRILSAVNNLRR